MVEEGGRWDVGVKDNEVFLKRVDEGDERLFDDLLAPHEARRLAELLNKFAAKADENASDDEDEAKDDDDKDEDEDDDDKDEDEDEDEDDGDDEDEDQDEAKSSD